MHKNCLYTAFRGILVLVLLLAVLPWVITPAQATTFTVTNTNDSGPGSLRQAITDANNNPGPDVITFNIPATDPGYWTLTSAWVIQPNSLLPSLSGDDTTVDGYTQSVNQGDTNIFGPEVEITGVNLAASDWLLSLESNNNTIKGLAITRAGGSGIRIRSSSNNNIISGNYIGTDPAGIFAWGNGTGIEIYGASKYNTISGNVISGNTLDGIKISDSGTDSNDVKNNIIGLDSSGVVALPNGGYGISILNGAQHNSVGGDIPDRNTISGNSKSGVYIHGTGTDSNLVWYNYIGTVQSGTSAAGNANNGVFMIASAQSNIIQNNLISGNLQHGVYLSGSGTDNNFVRLNIIGADKHVTNLIPNGWHNVAVYDGASSNWIGTISPPWGNVIVGAGWSGVVLHKSNQNSVLHNAIGTNEAGTATNLGNSFYGVHVEGMQNTIGVDNTIAYNTLDGIRVDGKTVPAQFNTITQNAIYSNGGLGIELWSNGNNELPAPVITSASCHLIEGSVCAGCIVEIFSDSNSEGKLYVGTTTANAILPAFSWNGTAFGPKVTATATDSQGNTSEFSAPFSLSCSSPIAVVSVLPPSGPPGTTFRFDASGSNDLEDPTSALEVRWDWEDDGNYDTPWSTTKIIDHTLHTPGDHFIRVQVRDTDGLVGSADQLVRVVQMQTVFMPLMVNHHP